ncbi:MAG: DUF4147 domain-containing protein [Anaerolineales bacterium]|nr:DUF4147 domain-containing protein [Anaerolineales bacterium]
MSQPRFQDHRQHIIDIYEAALGAVDPYNSVRQALARTAERPGTGTPQSGSRLWLVAAGKAAIPMARAAADQLGDRLHQGIIVTKSSATVPADLAERYPELALHLAAHPVSDASSVAATEAVAAMLQGTSADDVVLCLISGGCSALLTRPLLTLPAWQQLNRALLASGCSIHTFNRIRQHLDEVKGGGLLRWAAPAAVRTLILSDVIGDDLSIIGSGPTVPPAATPAEADALLRQYDIYAQLAPATADRIQALLTSAPVDSPFPPYDNELVANLTLAAQAARERASQLGFTARFLTGRLDGDADQLGRFAAALAVDAPANEALILGGEATVQVRGQGRGGRNQELALAAAPLLDGGPPLALAALATDGEDRITGVAGAIATHLTANQAATIGLDITATLADNDSYAFWQALNASGEPLAGGLVERDPTGTNVNDLLIILRYEN